MLVSGKVNLFLRVGGVRSGDGRHRIATLFLPLNRLEDRVEVVPARRGAGIRLRLSGRAVPCPPEENLACKAATAFCRRFGGDGDWEIALEKRIPVSAGLGGGSADAAAVLRQMAAKTGQGVRQTDLSSLALELGADVPFFLKARPAFATGVGDVLAPVEVTASFGIVVAYPGTPSPVAWAYRHVRPRRGPLPKCPAPSRLATLEGLAALVENDLAAPLLEKTPLLGMLLSAMRTAGCVAAAVSGSGSACFGLCAAGEGEAVCGRLRAALRDVRPLEVFWAAEYG